MPVLTITPQPANNPPRILLQVTGETGAFGSPANIVTVVRRNTDGSSYTVRTGNPGTVIGGAWTGYDYESPFGLGGTYTVTPDVGFPVSGSVAALREYGVQQPWLIHPGIPALSMPITVARPGPVPVSDINQGVFNVLGRKDAVVRTDGVRKSPTLTLTVSTYTWDEEDDFAKLIDDASTLLLQITYPEWERSKFWWVSIGQVTPQQMVDYLGNTFVQWSCACTVTGPPAGLLQAQWTCAGVVNAYSSCLDVLSSFATCDDLLINFPIAV